MLGESAHLEAEVEQQVAQDDEDERETPLRGRDRGCRGDGCLI